MTSSPVLLTIEGPIATIQLNCPERLNAYDAELAEGLLQISGQVKSNTAIHVVVLQGAGKVFCVGGNIEYFAKELAQLDQCIPDIMECLKETIHNFTHMDKPIIASVHGAVAGVGLSFMCACDLAIAADNTKFNFAYSHLGISPDGGLSYFLPRIIGHKCAMEMALLSEPFNVEKAEQLGLINWAVESEHLSAATTKRAQQLANMPPLAITRIKRLFYQSWQTNLEKQLDDEGQYFAECSLSQDFKEGVGAFIEKRRPVFQGK